LYLYRQWRQRLGNFGDGLTQRGRYPGERKSPSGVQGQRPNRGSSAPTTQADTYSGNGCKTGTSAVNSD